MKFLKSIAILAMVMSLFNCSDNNEAIQNESEVNLIIKFKFDSTQERLNNFGELANIPAGNAAQSPVFKRMSANYIELAPNALTALGTGEIVFEGAETSQGGAEAIDFQSAVFAGNNETFITIPLSTVAVGNYDWVRVSLAYQEGAIDFLHSDGNDYTGTLASFVGYNTFISSFDLNGSNIPVNANRLQGFWAFETLGFTAQGQAPEGATTVPNPLFNSSPIPQGSCVVTGQFENEFTITGEETEDVEVVLFFSVNNSFEWTEVNVDGKYEPSAGEQVVDMGLRGLIPMVSN